MLWNLIMLVVDLIKYHLKKETLIGVLVVEVILHQHLIVIQAGSGSITLSAGDMSNAGGALVGATSHTLSVKFADGFNDHIGGDKL